MTLISYIDLIIHSEEENIKILERPLKAYKGRVKGNKILINSEMSECEKACILAEELGHYHTTVGNILDQSISNNRKQEKTARRWAVHELIEIDELINAIKSGYESLSDIAEYLNVTVDFLLESIDVFKCEYGICFQKGDFIITFNDIGINVRNITEEE